MSIRVEEGVDAIMKILIIAIVLISPCLGGTWQPWGEDSSKTTTTPSPTPRPYSFQYQTGRYPEKVVNWVHQESGDGTRHVQGSYSFTDSNHNLQPVQYTGYGTGFHPFLTYYWDTRPRPIESEAVRRANDIHFRLYQQIAEANSHPPQETPSVMSATNRHLQIYDQIARQHAAIGAARG